MWQFRVPSYGWKRRGRSPSCCYWAKIWRINDIKCLVLIMTDVMPFACCRIWWLVYRKVDIACIDVSLSENLLLFTSLDHRSGSSGTSYPTQLGISQQNAPRPTFSLCLYSHSDCSRYMHLMKHGYDYRKTLNTLEPHAGKMALVFESPV